MDNFESDLDELLDLYRGWQLAEFNYHNHSVESIRKMEEKFREARSKFLKYGAEPDCDEIQGGRCVEGDHRCAGVDCDALPSCDCIYSKQNLDGQCSVCKGYR